LKCESFAIFAAAERRRHAAASQLRRDFASAAGILGTRRQSVTEPDPMNVEVKRRPRTKPPEERRDDLMNAAQRLFLENGVGPTTIDQITAGADVAKGTFYLYFSSKTDVLAALRERFVRDYLDGIRAAIAKRPADDWAGMLTAWVKAGLDGYLDAIPLHDLVFREPESQPHKHIGNNITVTYLAEVLRAGVSAGAWRLDDPDFTALFLFHALHGSVHDAAAQQERLNRTRLVRTIETLFFRVVGLC
jgi:AcrR family transcriptional regulator